MLRTAIATLFGFLVFSGIAAASDGWLIRSADSGHSTFTGSLVADPIVFPGQPGVGHLHDFFCNRETTAFSFYEQMIAAPSSCPSGDTAGYWTPALYEDGIKINPTGPVVREQLYYRDNNVTAGTLITPFPADFKMVVGDAKATSLTDAQAINSDSGIGSKIPSEMYWGCSNNSTSKLTVPQSCSTGIITQHIGFPNCWNGLKVAGDQIKAGTMRYPSSGVCPFGYNVVLPRLLERFEYAVGTTTGAIALASGETYTAHADFWNTWDQPSLVFLVANCLNKGIDCGTNPAIP